MPESGTSDHAGIAAVALLLMLVAVVLKVWREPSPVALLACFPLALTGALTRRAFADALDSAVARAARGDGTCSVAILDVDHFKAINDALGHAAGDLALQRLTAVVESRMRRGDVVGRLGGEEFAIVLDGTDASGAEAYAESLRAFAAATADAEIPAFTVSIGVAELADGDATSERMLIAADHALYAAKAAGRDRDRVMCAPRPPARCA